MAIQDVKGWCPMGCGRTLRFQYLEGLILCKNPDCPEPNAVTKTLSDRRPTEHLVVIGMTDFEIQHPLSERVTRSLLDCEFTRWLGGLEGPPVEAGTYRVRRQGDALTNAIGPDNTVTVEGWHFQPTQERF